MKKSTITIKIDQLKVKRGHQPHRSGSGIHADRRLKRMRTRGRIASIAIRDSRN